MIEEVKKILEFIKENKYNDDILERYIQEFSYLLKEKEKDKIILFYIFYYKLKMYIENDYTLSRVGVILLKSCRLKNFLKGDKFYEKTKRGHHKKS